MKPIQQAMTLTVGLFLAACHQSTLPELPKPDTTKPVVSLAASKTTLTAADFVILTATATDDTAISKVEFYEENVLIATKLAPYTHAVGFTIANNGVHSYIVKAYDEAGNVATSSKVDITVNVAATLASVSATNWLNGAKGAHTLAHDDYCSNTSGIQRDAIPLLNARGLKASLGVIANLCDETEWSNLQQDAALGHEIFNHTLTHMGEFEAGTVAPIAGWNMETEIKGAHDLVKSKIGIDMSFIGFPSDLTSDTTRNYVKSLGYLGARAAKNGYDGSVAGLNAVSQEAGGVIDWGDSISPYFIKWDVYLTTGKYSMYTYPYGQVNDILIQHAQKAIDAGVWTYRTMHGVNDESWESVPLDQYTAYVDFLKTKVDSGDLWVDTPSQIIRYRGTRANCAVSKVGNMVHFNTSKADCTRYATALTLDLVTDGQPIVTQNDQVLPVKAASTAGHWYVNANPTLGDLSIR